MRLRVMEGMEKVSDIEGERVRVKERRRVMRSKKYM